MSATRTGEHGGLRTGDERLQELSTARFAAALAAANPTPGGSTAAALPAALAAALVGMVARLSA